MNTVNSCNTLNDYNLQELIKKETIILKKKSIKSCSTYLEVLLFGREFGTVNARSWCCNNTEMEKFKLQHLQRDWKKIVYHSSDIFSLG